MATDECALSRMLHELGSHVSTREPWLFVIRDGKGALRVFSNARRDEMRELTKQLLKRKAAPRAE